MSGHGHDICNHVYIHSLATLLYLTWQVTCVRRLFLLIKSQKSLLLLTHILSYNFDCRLLRSKKFAVPSFRWYTKCQTTRTFGMLCSGVACGTGSLFSARGVFSGYFHCRIPILNILKPADTSWLTMKENTILCNNNRTHRDLYALWI